MAWIIRNYRTNEISFLKEQLAMFEKGAAQCRERLAWCEQENKGFLCTKERWTQLCEDYTTGCRAPIGTIPVDDYDDCLRLIEILKSSKLPINGTYENLFGSVSNVAGTFHVMGQPLPDWFIQKYGAKLTQGDLTRDKSLSQKLIVPS